MVAARPQNIPAPGISARDAATRTETSTMNLLRRLRHPPPGTTAHATDAADGRFAVFRHGGFARYWTARFASAFATQIVGVSVGWQIYDLTRNPLDLGLIGLIQFLPSLLLFLITGEAADRFGRRMIMSICVAVEAGCAAAILLLTLRGLTGPLPIFLVLAAFGVARAFFGPASQSLVANLVPQKDLAGAIAWNSTSWQTATIVGPVAGGLLYGVSAETAYGTATALFCIALLLILSVPRPAQRTEREKRSLHALLAGFRYIRGEKVVLGAISLDMFAVLLGGAVALLPVYARDILQMGPWGLGLLRAAPGLGAIAMAFYLTANPIRHRAGLAMFVAVGIFGLSTTVFGLSEIAWLSIGALAVMGAADMVSVYIRQTLIQLWTPDRLRGRVSAVNMVFVGASNELGEFRAGGMAALIGTVPAVVLGGIGSVAVAVLWSRWFPALRRVNSVREGR